jgi:hypothetical protein
MRAERIAPVLFMLAIAGACSGNDQGATVQNAQGGSLNVSSGGTTGLHPSGGTGAGPGSGGSGTIPADAACAQGTSQASLAQLTMFVMFDDSGSMNDKPVPPQTTTKWTQASAAMASFFGSPSTAGMQVWLRLFPKGNCSKSSCAAEQAPYPNTVAACSQPTVPLGALTAMSAPADTQEQALVKAIPANATLGGTDDGTPMSAALQGVENAAAAYAQANPAQAPHTVVVLVTDGTPNGCAAKVDPDVANIAGAAFAANGIKTYAVGLLGSNQADMDAIAKQGGTMKGIPLGSNGSTQQQLLDAFGAIQTANASCDFDVPPPPAGLTLDPNTVNVNYTDGAGATTTFPEVSSATACGTNGAWYYTNGTSHITLCDSACTTVKADPGARVDVLFGCQSTCLATDPNCNVK